MMEEKANSWRDIVSVITLFYIPPIGVIVMWFISRWSVTTKWIATLLIGIIPLVILGSTTYNGYRFVQYQRSYAPVVSVQQALDVYGIANGKYPAKLDELKPKYINAIPTDKSLEYTVSTDTKTYTLKGVVDGKQVELHPALNFPSTSATASTTATK
jgi:hypothetical protein